MMRHLAKLRILAALALTINAARAEDLTAVVTRIEKRVEVQKGGAAWEPAVPKMRLAVGDKIHTGFRATATVRFADGSVIDIKPMSMVMLQKLEDANGKVKNRVWLKVGELSAKVERPLGTPADFQVKTPTTTASVRGTRIRSIATHPGIGTVVRMGTEGRMQVAGRTGRVHVDAEDETVQRDSEATPLTPEEMQRREGAADIQPAGTLREEQDDILDTGVPKTNPLAGGGSGLASDLTRETIEASDQAVSVILTTRVQVPVPALP